MKKLVTDRMKQIVFTLCTLSSTLIACQRQSSKLETPGNNTIVQAKQETVSRAESRAAPAGGAPSLGTTDGAGGNSFKGKMLETYIVDPRTLPAYKAHLERLFKHLQPGATDQDQWNYKAPSELDATLLDSSADPFGIAAPYSLDGTRVDQHKRNSFANAEKTLSNGFQIKIWYVAPVTLKPVPQADIGFDVTRETPDQVALQTDKEIWLDQKNFQSLDTLGQATLVLHEYLVQLYLAQFWTYEEYCGNMNRQTGAVDFCNYQEFSKGNYIDRFDPHPKRSLSADDYAKVRQVTQILMSRTTPIYTPEFRELLFSNGFGKQYATRKPDPRVDSPRYQVDISVSQLEKFFKPADFKSALKKCMDWTTGKVINCNYELKSETVNGQSVIKFSAEMPSEHNGFTGYFQTVPSSREMRNRPPPGIPESYLENGVLLTREAGSSAWVDKKYFDDSDPVVTINSLFGSEGNGWILLTFQDARTQKTYEVGDKFYQLSVIFRRIGNTLTRVYGYSISVRKVIGIERDENLKFCLLGPSVQATFPAGVPFSSGFGTENADMLAPRSGESWRSRVRCP